MAKYKLTEDGSVFDRDRGATIPADIDNKDWRRYLAWMTAGGVADPVDVTPAPTAEELIEQELLKTNTQMIRTLDWLLKYLVQNGVVQVNDIPVKLKQLYQERQNAGA